MPQFRTTRRRPSLRLRQAWYRIEALEPRQLLSVAPQVAGALSGKILYTSGGHGWWWNATDNAWDTMRTYINGLMEDMGNQDQLEYYADAGLRAGATVASMRPLGHQTSEALVDNADTYSAATGGFQIVSGTWTANTTTTPYWSDHNGADTNHWVFAATSAAETAVARFVPNIPAAGFYPVYCWTNPGQDKASTNDRVPDQLYRVNYAGGSQEIHVAQNEVGNGWIYLGSYYFDAGVNPTGGSVEVSNKSAFAAAGKYVIADGMRFGNGMGDWTASGAHAASGYPREDEAALYWCYDSRGWNGANNRVAQSVVDAGSSSDDMTKNFSACDRYATYMNNGNVGAMTDRLWISFHSNAGGGRGTLGLINTVPTQNQAWLANTAGTTVQTELGALDAEHEYAWSQNPSPTFTGGYSEISKNVIGTEFDATIIEVAYHDNAQDAALLKDPKVRNEVGRAAFHTAIKYFDNFDGNFTNTTYAPEPPTDLRATTDASGNVILNWSAGPSSAGMIGPYGNAATGYRVWTSTNGYGFSLAATIGNLSTFTLGGLPLNAMTYFRVTAINAGGESAPSAVVAGKPQLFRRAGILIVNNFSRLDRPSDQLETDQFYPTQSGTISRVRQRYNNTFDYVVQAADAIASYNTALGVESCTDQAIANGEINLFNYRQVIWLSGEQSTANETFTAATEPLVTNYLNAGGHLFVSGAEIAWDLFGQAGETAADRAFLNSTLHANYVANDAGAYSTVAGTGAFSSVPALSFDDGTHGTYDVDTPDVISANGSGASAVMNYSNGSGAAMLAYAPTSGANTRIVYMGFPFESIYTQSQRNALMSAVLSFFGANNFAYVFNNVLHVEYAATGNTVSLVRNDTNVDATQSTTLSFPVANFTSIVADGTSGADTLGFTGAITQPLTFNGGAGGDALAVHGGTLTFNADAAATTTNLAVTVDVGASAVFNATQHLGALTINGTATVSAGGAKVLVAKSLSVPGMLDLSDNDAIVNYDPPASNSPLGSWNGSVYTGLSGRIASGRNGGSWNGAGIRSSTAAAAGGSRSLSIDEASRKYNLSGSQTASFSGETVDATSVVIKFTYTGDADSDGRLTVNDYFMIDAGFLGATQGWTNGDFDYNGHVNGDDYFWIDSDFADQNAIL